MTCPVQYWSVRRAPGLGSVADQQYLEGTRRAIAAQVFGSPTYVVEGERYWGQDRLDLLAEKLLRA